ncbi:MAG: hypothetical protein ACKO8N_15070, partial [Rubrivivax sp.]
MSRELQARGILHDCTVVEGRSAEQIARFARAHHCATGPARKGSELVKYSGAPERAFQRVPIQAQSTAVARATASICNDERGRLGRTSG